MANYRLTAKKKGMVDHGIRKTEIEPIGALAKEIERARILKGVKKNDLCGYVSLSTWTYNQFLRGKAGITAARLDKMFERLGVFPILRDI